MNRRIAGSIAAVLVLYVAERAAILASGVHLLFDVNEAEYGFLRVVGDVADRPLGAILGNPGARAAFLHECATVGNQVHGTLSLWGTLLLIAVHLGAPLGTMTLKGLALGTSAVALLAWCLALARATRRAAPVLAFGALYTLSPPVFVKTSLVFWGTHEAVSAIFALLVLAFAPWVGDPAPPARAALRVMVAAAAGALAVVANYSLGLAAAFLVAWLAAGAGRRRGGAAGAGLAAGLSLLGAGVFLAVVQATLASGLLMGADLPRGLHPGGPLWLSGRGGRPFFFLADRVRWDALGTDLLRFAMPTFPGPSYGRWAVPVECGVRIAILLACGWVLLRRRSGEDPEQRPIAAFLAAYLPLAFAAVTGLSLAFELAPGVATGITPRYYAHLYPVAMAVGALWATSGRRWVRLPALAWVLWLGLWEHHLLVDPGNLGAWARYDGARIYFARRGMEPSARVALPLGGASDDFIAGMRFLEVYQRPDYFSWRTPLEMARERHGEALAAWVATRGEGSAEFHRGVGYALRVLVPPARAGIVEEAIAGVPGAEAELRRGYGM